MVFNWKKIEQIFDRNLTNLGENREKTTIDWGKGKKPYGGFLVIGVVYKANKLTD